jgi:hypothetical protein
MALLIKVIDTESALGIDSGAIAAIRFATLTNAVKPVLTNVDFFII